MSINDGIWVDGELVFVNATNADNTPDWIDGELKIYYETVTPIGGQLLQHPGMDGLGSYQFNNKMNGGFNA